MSYYNSNYHSSQYYGSLFYGPSVTGQDDYVISENNGSRAFYASEDWFPINSSTTRMYGEGGVWQTKGNYVNRFYTGKHSWFTI